MGNTLPSTSTLISRASSTSRATSAGTAADATGVASDAPTSALCLTARATRLACASRLPASRPPALPDRRRSSAHSRSTARSSSFGGGHARDGRWWNPASGM
jgi:hypothetical protein